MTRFLCWILIVSQTPACLAGPMVVCQSVTGMAAGQVHAGWVLISCVCSCDCPSSHPTDEADVAAAPVPEKPATCCGRSHSTSLTRTPCSATADSSASPVTCASNQSPLDQPSATAADGSAHRHSDMCCRRLPLPLQSTTAAVHLDDHQGAFYFAAISSSMTSPLHLQATSDSDHARRFVLGFAPETVVPPLAARAGVLMRC